MVLRKTKYIVYDESGPFRTFDKKADAENFLEHMLRDGCDAKLVIERPKRNVEDIHWEKHL
jgi:hypothetical protein